MLQSIDVFPHIPYNKIEFESSKIIVKLLIFLDHNNVNQRESLKEDVEKLICQAGGVKSSIRWLHSIPTIHKDKNNGGFNLAMPLNVEKEGKRPCPVPDGLPKSLEELEEEERGRMPDLPYTRLLRTEGNFPA